MDSGRSWNPLGWNWLRFGGPVSVPARWWKRSWLAVLYDDTGLGSSYRAALKYGAIYCLRPFLTAISNCPMYRINTNTPLCYQQNTSSDSKSPLFWASQGSSGPG